MVLLYQREESRGFGLQGKSRAFCRKNFLGFASGNPSSLTATCQKSVDHNPLTGKNPEKLVGHNPGKI
jgi:hypothetical protein